MKLTQIISKYLVGAILAASAALVTAQTPGNAATTPPPQPTGAARRAMLALMDLARVLGRGEETRERSGGKQKTLKTAWDGMGT